MNLLITGATGKLGSQIVKHVLELKKEENIYVSVRDAEKAKSLKEKGVSVRTGNFDDPASLDLAFADIDRLVLVSTDGDTPTRIRQHKTAIDAAKRAGVKEIIYTSLSKADNSPLNLAEVHKVTEAYLIQSQIEYKILRNNWYLENEADTVRQAVENGTITTTYGQGRIGWMERDEYALAAAHALLGAGETNSIYTLSNQLNTMDGFAETLGKLLGKTITMNHIEDQAYQAILLQAQMPKEVADFVVAMGTGIREGGLDAFSQDYQRLTGKEPKPLSESLKSLL